VGGTAGGTAGGIAGKVLGLEGSCPRTQCDAISQNDKKTNIEQGLLPHYRELIRVSGVNTLSISAGVAEGFR
jgi:hypothetical protein